MKTAVYFSKEDIYVYAKESDLILAPESTVLKIYFAELHLLLVSDVPMSIWSKYLTLDNDILHLENMYVDISECWAYNDLLYLIKKHISLDAVDIIKEDANDKFDLILSFAIVLFLILMVVIF